MHLIRCVLTCFEGSETKPGLDIVARIRYRTRSPELLLPCSTTYFSLHGRMDDTSATFRSWMSSWQFEHSKMLRPSCERAIGCAQFGQSGHMFFPGSHQVWLETI